MRSGLASSKPVGFALELATHAEGNRGSSSGAAFSALTAPNARMAPAGGWPRQHDLLALGERTVATSSAS
jgi:hypothetical protein